jgi:hypothetical protein
VGLATVVPAPRPTPDGEPDEPAGTGDRGHDTDDKQMGRTLLGLRQQQ